MIIFPAIDLYEKKAVRLEKGDYNKMTVYSNDPESLAYEFAQSGAQFLHTVDLEGAKNGTTPNLSVVSSIEICAPLPDRLFSDCTFLVFTIHVTLYGVSFSTSTV